MIQTSENTGKKRFFYPPSYCDEGQSVFVAKGNRWVRTRITTACGVHGRVVNEDLGIDRWLHIGDMRVTKEFTAKDYLKDLLWKPVRRGKETMWKQPSQWWEPFVVDDDKPILSLAEACKVAGVELH